jgi:hypothetical protein
METAIPPEHRDPAFDLPEVRRVQSRVDSAAEKLLQRGVAPTVERIRVEIGGASPNAVAPALRYWRLRRDRALGKAADPIPSPVFAAARALYDTALQVAARTAGTGHAELAVQLEAERARNEMLAAELKHLRREIETLQAERASVFEAAGHTHAELVNAQALATHCVNERRAVQSKFDASQKALGAARARITALEATLVASRAAGSGRASKRRAAKPATRAMPISGTKTPGAANGRRPSAARTATRRRAR